MHRQVVILGAGPAGLACARRCEQDYVLVDAAEQVGGLLRVVEESNGFLFQPALPVVYSFGMADRGEAAAGLTVLDASLCQATGHASCEFPIGPDGLPLEPDNGGAGGAILEKAGIRVRRTFGQRFRGAFPRRSGTPPASRLHSHLFAHQLMEDLTGYALARPKAVWLRTALGTLDTDARVVTFANREPVSYEHLISTIPLPELVSRTVCVPDDVREAARLLRSSDSMIVSIGVAGHCTDRAVVYCADPEISFTRVVVVTNLSSLFAPAGSTSMNVEVASPSDRPIPRAGIIRRVLTDLIQVRLLRPADRILHMSVYEAPQAYPNDDEAARSAVAAIRTWYAERGVRLAGRGGLWQRLGVQGAIESGAAVAAELRPACAAPEPLNRARPLPLGRDVD